MCNISNREDYWVCVNANWTDILALFGKVGIDLRSEQGVGEMLEIPLYKHLEMLREKRSPNIVHYFDWVWGVAPDRPYIHEWAGWFALCDLCSESWVFEEEPDATE